MNSENKDRIFEGENTDSVARNQIEINAENASVELFNASGAQRLPRVAIWSKNGANSFSAAMGANINRISMLCAIVLVRIDLCSEKRTYSLPRVKNFASGAKLFKHWQYPP